MVLGNIYCLPIISYSGQYYYIHGSWKYIATSYYLDTFHRITNVYICTSGQYYNYIHGSWKHIAISYYLDTFHRITIVYICTSDQYYNYIYGSWKYIYSHKLLLRYISQNY